MKVHTHPDVGAKMAEEESARWNVIKSLEGRIADSLEMLQKLIPHHDLYEVERSSSITGFEAYVRRSRVDVKDRKLIAYGCPNCKKIIVGQPEIRPIDIVSDLNSNCGYDMACKLCDDVIYHKDYQRPK